MGIPVDPTPFSGLVGINGRDTGIERAGAAGGRFAEHPRSTSCAVDEQPRAPTRGGDDEVGGEIVFLPCVAYCAACKTVLQYGDYCQAFAHTSTIPRASAVPGCASAPAWAFYRNFTESNLTMNFLYKLTVSNRVAAIALACLALPCIPVLAQSADTQSQAAPASGGMFGLGVAYVPRYQGSDESEIRVLPLLEYHWANGIFIGGENNTVLGMQFSEASGLRYGIGLGVSGRRKENTSRALSGMGDIANKPTLNAFVKYALTKEFALNSNMQLGAGQDRNGNSIQVEGSYAIRLNPSLQLSLNVGASYANAAYMQEYFGVSASQARTSGYRAFTPSAGLRDVTAGVRLSYQINPSWTLLSGISNASLSSDAKDSPVVRQANSQKVFIGFGFRN
jgi:outer membrane protein